MGYAAYARDYRVSSKFRGTLFSRISQGHRNLRKYILAIISWFTVPGFKYIANTTNINNLVTIRENIIANYSAKQRNFRPGKISL